MFDNKLGVLSNSGYINELGGSVESVLCIFNFKEVYLGISVVLEGVFTSEIMEFLFVFCKLNNVRYR